MPAKGTPTDTSLKIGDHFPEFETIDLDGNATVLDKELLGERFTLVIFWSTWCGFCMDELPHEVELARQYEQAGLRVIGINADDTPMIARQAVVEHGVPWLNVFEGPEMTVSRQLGIKQWPVVLLLDGDGTVVSATNQLRAIGVETAPDGSTRQVNGLDSTLGELLGGP